MTTKQLIRRLNRLAAGEYVADTNNLFVITSKARSDFGSENPITCERFPKLERLVPFAFAFDQAKYGLEYATNGKIRYVGTNDLNVLVVK